MATTNTWLTRKVLIHKNKNSALLYLVVRIKRKSFINEHNSTYLIYQIEIKSLKCAWHYDPYLHKIKITKHFSKPFILVIYFFVCTDKQVIFNLSLNCKFILILKRNGKIHCTGRFPCASVHILDRRMSGLVLLDWGWRIMLQIFTRPWTTVLVWCQTGNAFILYLTMIDKNTTKWY